MEARESPWDGGQWGSGVDEEGEEEERDEILKQGVPINSQIYIFYLFFIVCILLGTWSL